MHRPDRTAMRRAELVLLAAIGALLGVLVGGSVRAPIGPVDARLALQPALSGDTRVRLAPLGTVEFDSHDGPLRLDVTVDELRTQEARAILANPASLSGVEDRVSADLRRALWRLTLRTVASAGLGAALLVLVVFRRRRPVLLAGLVGLVATASAGSVTGATLNPRALAEPRYTGLLVNAPAVVGQARDIVERFSVYRGELAKLVTNVSQLYGTASSLPAYVPDRSVVRVLHVSDLHLNPAAWNLIRTATEQFAVDVIVDSGDLTDHGSRAEDRYADEIRRLRVPYVFIRGNHDTRGTETAVARNPNAIVLRGQAATVAGLRFYGAGDPRFTPDRTTRESVQEQTAALERAGRGLADGLAGAEPPGIDVAVVHDPAMARPLDGAVPLVLAGHTHQRRTEVLAQGTRLLAQGSTGGAGLRGLEGEEPTPFQMSVLYVDRASRALRAWDEITVGGLGTTSARIARHLAGEARPAEEPLAEERPAEKPPAEAARP